MSEAKLISAIVQQIRSAEDTLPLRDAASCSQLFLHDRPTSKVLLFFHGFTAVPQQFASIGQAFFNAGYNVLIPRLPGHGLAGHWNRDCPPPLPENPQVYQDFGLKWLQYAQVFGDQVVLGGLSGGSTLSAWLALERPQQIDRALLFAAYLKGANIVVDLVVRSLDIYFEWKTKPGSKNFGYQGFHMPALRAFLEIGQEVLHRANNQLAAPMLIVSSEADTAVNSKHHQILFESVLKRQPRSWYYCFDRSLDVPHNMMTQEEGNRCLDLLIAIARSYVESDLTWFELEEIRDRVSEGKTFNSVINELTLECRASPDLQTLTTIVPL
jgi:esterase/lipase